MFDTIRYQIALTVFFLAAAPIAVGILSTVYGQGSGEICTLTGGLFVYQAGTAPVWHVVGLRTYAICRAMGWLLFAAGVTLCVQSSSYPAGFYFGIVLTVLPVVFMLWSRSVATLRVPSAPVGPGTYVIIHGGAPGLCNRHAGAKDQRFAVDLVRVDANKRRATGLLPEKLDAYASYGATVCAVGPGKVVAIGDATTDAIPGRPQMCCDPRGNFVVQTLDGHEVLYAHLLPGSIAVRVGDNVSAGQMLGSIGNSGFSTEPHLHIHIEANGTGVGFRFQGLVPQRNQIFSVDVGGRVHRSYV